MFASRMSKQRLGTAITGNAIMVLVARVTGILFTLLGARLLDQQGLGNILIGTGVLLLASTLAGLGFPGSVPHFVTVCLVKDDERALSSLFHAAIVILVPVSVAIAYCISSYAEFIATYLYSDPSITPILTWMAWGIPFLALSKIFTAALRGMNRTILAAFIDDVLWRALPLTLLLVIAILGIKNDMLIAQSVAMTPVLIAAIGLFYIAPMLRNISFFRLPVVDRELLSYTINSWITSLATLLRSRGDLILLGIFLSSAEVAVYSVGATLVMILQINTNIVNPAYRPMATRLITEGKSGNLISYHKRIVRLNLVIVGPISVFLLFFSEPFVTMLFGAKYASSATVLQIMLLGVVPRAFMGPVNPALLSLGLANVVRRIDVATTFWFIISLIVLTPLAGIVGAALAFGGTGIFQHGWKNIEVRKHIQIPWIANCGILPFFALLMVSGGLLQVLSTNLPSFGWLIIAPVFAAVSLVAAFVTNQITGSEAAQIVNLLRKRFRGVAKAN